jgi:flagellar protein FliO/FliZ
MPLHSDMLDSVEESTTLAAGTGLPSPVAEIAAQPVPEPLTAERIDALQGVPSAPAAAVAAKPIATPAVAPVAVTTVATGTQAPAALGTLVPGTPGVLPMVGALLLVVGVIVALGRIVRRVQQRQGGAGAALALKGGVQVGTKERVVWMQAGETHLLLGVSPGHVQTLHVFDVAPDLAAPAANETAMAAESPAMNEFSARLKGLLARAQAKGIEVPTVAVPPPAAAASAPATTPATARAASAKPTFSFRA